MSGFLSVILFVVASILAAIAIASWQKGGHRNYWIAFGWGMAAYVLLGFATFFTYYFYVIKPAKEGATRPAKEHLFAAASQATMFGCNRAMDGLFWLEHKTAGGVVVSPIHVMIFLRLTNLKDEPITIDSYAVEIKSPSKDWVKLPRVDVQDGILYSDVSSNAGAWNVGQNGFDRAIFERRIQPRETVRGWAFFEIPGRYCDEEYSLRFRLKDFSGAESVEPLEDVSKVDTVQKGALLMPMGVTKDLSRTRRAFYSESK